ncbi:GspH/FimT family pseudopilin [Rehaibacterium terrae]|uniref:Type II secretion system protein H n=1 Tax=Rehaibacterium terrae TaxID=1341696 RepID=A0A7W7XZ95_9GAMM|nr:GspH/FimT family pseudopilin [Rehaibacterium terrae]MBB5015191.1 type IV fimbrial biogenesis protein FimT [Rehaibacterium terrae]
MHTQARGLTMIELLIALTIAAILFGVAIPAIGGAFEAARSQDARAALLGTFVEAVNKATLSGQRAVLCPSADGTACLDSADWSDGWIAFLDGDGNRERSADERLIRHQPALGGKVRLRSTEGRKRIVFQAHGGNAGSNVTFTLCDGRGPAKAQTLVLNNQGRMRYGEPSAEAIARTCLR